MIGPNRPDDLHPVSEVTHSSTSSDEEDIGPPPPTAGVLSSHPSETEAARVFREREARIAEAKAAHLEQEAKSGTERQEWMLKLPTNPDLQKRFGDPLSLKARKFNQTSSRRAGEDSGNDPDTTLWTETPKERSLRLQAEASGSLQGMDPTLNITRVTDQNLELARERRRADGIDSQIIKNAESRRHSLLDLHRQHRESDHDREHRKRRRHERERDKSRSPDRFRRTVKEEDDRRHTHNRHSDRSRSPDRSRRRAKEDDGHRRTHSRRDPASSPHEHSSHSEPGSRKKKGVHSHSRRSKEGHHSPKDARSGDGRHGEGRSSKAKAKDTSDSHVGSWDWDKAMAGGSKLLSETDRKKSIQQAGTLSDRFGRGSSSYL